MQNAGCKTRAAQLQQCQGKAADAPKTGTMPGQHVVEVVDMGRALASESSHVEACNLAAKERWCRALVDLIYRRKSAVATWLCGDCTEPL